MSNKLLAPNGKPSNLNATQYELVRTTAFKKWFGDWENDPANSSKVVDENGEPLVVYRGMPKKRRVGNIFRYNVNMFGTKGVGSRKTNKFAFYFTDIKEVADEYGRNLSDDDDSEWIIKEYFLNIRNIFKAFTKKNEYELIFKKLYDLANKTGNKIYAKDSSGEILTDWRENKIEWLDYYRMRDYYKNESYFKPVYSYFSDWNKDDENQAFWRVYLKDFLGYDGLVFYETTWNMDFDKNFDTASPRYGNEYSKTYAVFEPNQIKLADGTNTIFDSGNDDIRFYDGGMIEDLINKGIVELKFYETTPEHAREYGLISKKPIYLQTIFVSENSRLKGVGKQVLDYLENYAKNNGNDLIFGHINNKAQFTKDDRETFFSDVDMIRYWLQNNGYDINEDNNDFHKLIRPNENIRFEKGGEIDNFIDFFDELKIEDGSKYIGQKFRNVFPFLGKYRFVPNDFRISVKQYEGVLSRLEQNDYSSKIIKQKDLNKLERIKNNIDKKYFLAKFYLDGTGTIVQFKSNEFSKGGRTISQTPAPKKDQVKGSDINKKSSSKDLSSAKLIKFDDKTLEAIKNKVKEHNGEHPDKKINLSSAKAVVRRGMGAYSKSHRPTISGGKPNSRVAWGIARLNAFTYKIVNGKSKSGKYSQDDDLIEELGYKVANYENGGKMSKDIRCINCGWEWNRKDSELWDMYVCHKCGFDNTSFYTSDGINRLLKGGRLNSNTGVTPNYLKMFLDL